MTGMFALVMSVSALGLTPLLSCAPETRHRISSTLFDGVPPLGTPRRDRRRRRPERVERIAKAQPSTDAERLSLEDLQAQIERESRPRYASYDALVAALPDDGLGNIDWLAAAETGLIRPRPGVDPGDEPHPILPYDVHLETRIPPFQVVFPHAAHTYWLTCNSCHPEIFRMKAGANPITMAKIFEGEYCGRCHGKVAFPVETGCPRCHVKLGRPSG